MPVVTYRSLRAEYTAFKMKEIGLKLKNYKQQDEHSCGFVAALTLVRYFGLSISDKEVLQTVRSSESGVDADQMKGALGDLGIHAEFCKGLSILSLVGLQLLGTPVLITVWPKGWSCDHWTIVQAIVDRVYLTNYRSLSFIGFKREWFDRGEGFVCSRE